VFSIRNVAIGAALVMVLSLCVVVAATSPSDVDLLGVATVTLALATIWLAYEGRRGRTDQARHLSQQYETQTKLVEKSDAPLVVPREYPWERKAAEWSGARARHHQYRGRPDESPFGDGISFNVENIGVGPALNARVEIEFPAEGFDRVSLGSSPVGPGREEQLRFPGEPTRHYVGDAWQYAYGWITYDDVTGQSWVTGWTIIGGTASPRTFGAMITRRLDAQEEPRAVVKDAMLADPGTAGHVIARGLFP
jgi:hypothetical protein